MNIKANRDETTFETQATRLFEALQTEIVEGKLIPGARLIRRDLGARFNVSQATVTEALWRLEAEGLAESVPMYGTRVVQITLERVQAEAVLREALECEVARRVAQRQGMIDHSHLLKLAERLEGLRRKSGSYDHRGIKAHQEFHMALAWLTESALLIREMERIWQRHLAFFSWHSARVLPPPKRWHHRLLDAIFTGDPDVAERAMRDHVRFGGEQQLEVLRQMEATVAKKTAKS